MIRLNAVHISRCRFLNKKELAGAVSSILRRFGIRDAELSIFFATDREIKRLNKLYRRRNAPTDVLSFLMREGKRLKHDSAVLGDIVISVDRARAQAKIFGTSFKAEMELYIIHGVLHLLGYDDETPAAERKMRRKEQELLNAKEIRRSR